MPHKPLEDFLLGNRHWVFCQKQVLLLAQEQQHFQQERARHLSVIAAKSVAIEMKRRGFDARCQSEARPVFRMIAGVLGLIILGIGALSLREFFLRDVFIFDSQARFGMAATALGIGLLILCVRGKIFR